MLTFHVIPLFLVIASEAWNLKVCACAMILDSSLRSATFRMTECQHYLVESLADELKQLGIATPPVGNIHQTNEVHKWLKALPRLVGYSSRGDLDAAIRLGESLETDT